MKWGRLIIGVMLAWAQVQDDFSDGDFTANPTWSGTDAYWMVTTDYRLRSNGPAATATLYLSTPNALINNTEWRFWVRVAFNPSTANYARVYLVADRADLTDPALNGYYLKLGGITGASDSLELWRQQGGTHTRLAGGRAGRFGGTNNILWVRVLRDNAGTWQAFTDSSGYWESEFSVMDNTITTTSYFGVYFQHTSTNRQNLWLDDFYIGPPIVDTTPPQVLQAEALSPTLVRLYFSEAVEPTSATNTAAYSFVSGGLSVVAAARPTPATVELTVSPALQPSVVYTLQYAGVQDMAGNNGSGTVDVVLPEEPQPGDVIFSEIMAKPTPVVSLPPYEYVELYNRSARWLQVGGMQFCDGNQCATLGAAILPPGGYLLLVPSSAAGSYPGAVTVSSWPTLNDSGDSLTLWNASLQRLDYVQYASSWYRDPTKAQGGWSLERIDLNNLCATDSNWIASVASAGGTPGAANSVAGLWQDQTPPQLISVSFRSASEILLRFSEPVDSAAMRDLSRYTLSGGINISAVQVWDNEIQFFLATPLSFSTEYTFTVRVSDCVGNEATHTYVFGLPAPASPYDVVLTEIMADPDPPVGLPPYEYVELYNVSQKYISLEGWQLGVGSTQRVLPAYLLRPGQYVVLTSPEGAVALAPYGPCVGVPSFPALSNNGATIRLRDTAGQVIEEVTYAPSWYKDPAKDEGGWSLERKWEGWLCGGEEGWAASTAPVGGTPGQPNSLRQTTPPPAPSIKSAAYLPPVVQVLFSERMDTLLLSDISRYVWEPEVPLLAATSIMSGFGVELLPMVPLAENQTYRLRVTGLRTCAGAAVDTLWVIVRVPAPVEPGDVVINEILPEPQTGGSRYVELYNRSSKLIDVRDLLLARGATPVRYTEITSSSFLLEPGAYLCLTEDTADVQGRYLPPSTARFYQMRDFPTYDYQQDTVWLLRRWDSVTVDKVPYAASYHFPDLRTRKGVALERLSPQQPSEDPQNWYSAASSVRYGTPGYPNSQREVVSDSGPVRVEPKTFSPDGDGYEDLLWVYVWTDKAGTRADIRVHTLAGYKVRQVAEGVLLAVGENRFRWEGVDESGRRLPAGIYIIQVQLVEPQAGRTRTYRLPCAIAERLR